MNDEQISKSEASGQVISICRRMAHLYIAFAKTLVEEVGHETAEELIIRAISRYGREIGRKIREKVEERGLPATIENFRKFSDLPSLGFKTAVVIVGGEKRTRIDDCILASVWKELGEEGLGRLYCHVDQAKIEGYNSELEYVHVKNCLEGESAYCETAIRERAS